MRKLTVASRGRTNGNDPFPDGKTPVITIISPKKKTPAKKPKSRPKKKPAGKTKTIRKKRHP